MALVQDVDEVKEDLEELLESVDEAISNDETGDVSFYESVKDGATSMLEWIEANGVATEAQQTAVRNWADGVRRCRDRQTRF